jgi:TldD protein
MRRSAVSTSSAGVWAQRERHLLLSTEGDDLDQTVVKCGTDMVALATHDGVAQKRSNRDNHLQGGWEQIVAIDMPREGAFLGEEAAALVRAKPCPAATTTVVLDHEALSVQLHESIGHPIELDRVLGMEAGYAGTSFLSASDLDRRRVGSPHMNVTADTTTPGGLGTIGYDDEGVPAGRRPIIREGVLRGFLDSRETAARLGAGSGGFMRASSWNRVPLIRMANVHVDPGEGTLDDLLADVDDGLYLVTNKSWSIDEKRLNFQFGVEVAWEVKHGRRARMFRDAVYGGSTPEFWAGLDAVAGPEEWRLHGIVLCGKGQPGQHVHVSHGTPPARFQDVQVGCAR